MDSSVIPRCSNASVVLAKRTSCVSPPAPPFMVLSFSALDNEKVSASNGRAATAAQCRTLD